MEDALKKLFFFLNRQLPQRSPPHLQNNGRSADTNQLWSVARPHISLKARMLGEQAKTITRQGGFMR
jgi:hypothetical protein